MKINQKADPSGSINKFFKVHEIIACSQLLLNSSITCFVNKIKKSSPIERSIEVDVDVNSLFYQADDILNDIKLNEDEINLNTTCNEKPYYTNHHARRLNKYLCTFIHYVLACCGKIDDSFLPITINSFDEDELEDTFRLILEGSRVPLAGQIHKKRDLTNALMTINSTLDETINMIQNDLIYKCGKYSDEMCDSNQLITQFSDFKQVNINLINSILQHPNFNINPVDFAYLTAFIDLANVLTLQYYYRFKYLIHKSITKNSSTIEEYIDDESLLMCKGLDRLTYYMLQSLICSPERRASFKRYKPVVVLTVNGTQYPERAFYESPYEKHSLFYDVNEESIGISNSELKLKDFGSQQAVKRLFAYALEHFQFEAVDPALLDLCIQHTLTIDCNSIVSEGNND